MDKALQDQIPTFGKSDKAAQEVGLSNWSALTSGPGVRTWLEIAAIVLVAVVVIGGTEWLLRLFEVPQYRFPAPSQIGLSLINDFPILLPDILVTLKELLIGYAFG